MEVVVGCQRLGGGGCGLVVFGDGLFPDLLVMVVRGGDGLFSDLLVMVVRGDDGDSVWVCWR